MDLLQRRAMMAQKAEPEPQYVTDGLIHWLDGIDKGASDGTWVDLIGGHVYTNYGGVTSISNGFYFDGVDDRFYNNTFKVVTTPTTHTIEVVLSGAQVGSTGGYCLFSAYAAGGDANVKRFNVAFAGNLSVVILQTTLAFPTYPYVSASDVKSIVSSPDGKFYINNVQGTSTRDGYYASNGAANRIGCGYYNTNRHFYKGNIHAVRIYNRILTDDERGHNYALDLRRFNL